MYTVTAVYRIDPTAITGEGENASNLCQPDNTDYTGRFGLHNTATLYWSDVAQRDDACAPFTWSAPLLGATGSDVAPLSTSLGALAAVLAGGLALAFASRRRTRREG